MKNSSIIRKSLIAIFFIAAPFSSAVLAQSSDLIRYDMPQTGAKLYMPLEPAWDISYSLDSSIVYSTEVLAGNNFFGAIIVKFANSLGDDTETWEEVLKGYLQYLNTNAFLLESVSDIERNDETDIYPFEIGFHEYGKDAEDSFFIIRGWTNDKYLAVLYIAYIDEVDADTREQFLNGFQFPYSSK
jgi:hypothetical protein